MKNYLLCYDICDEKRLYQVAKHSYPLALGGQKSALEVPLSKKEAKYIIHKLSSLIDPTEDKVNLIEVEDNTIYLGMKLDIQYDEGMIII
jgi:CRISPR/Cas system-associated endoribonuclease Cas2